MSRSRHRAHRSPLKASMVLLGVGLAMLWATSSGTLSAWTSAGVANPTNSTGSNTLAFTHTYQSTSCSQGIRTSGTSGCSGSIAPTAATTTGGVTGTDTITNNGTYDASQLESSFSATSCAPVKFDNRRQRSPLLARYGTGFHTCGGPMDSVGYVSPSMGRTRRLRDERRVSQSQPGSADHRSATRYGRGGWFKTSTKRPDLQLRDLAVERRLATKIGLSTSTARASQLHLEHSGDQRPPPRPTTERMRGISRTSRCRRYRLVSRGSLPQVNLYVDGVQRVGTLHFCLGATLLQRILAPGLGANSALPG